MLEEAIHQHIMDFEFTVRLDALYSSLNMKMSFLIPTKKQRRKKQDSGMEIDLNVLAVENEPF